MTQSKIAACMGVVAFMVAGFITPWMAYGTLGYAASTIPWALFAIEKEFQKTSRRNKVLLVASVVFSFLSGHFQISLYVLAITVLFILYKTIWEKKWKTGIILFLFTLFALFIVSPQLLLTYDAYTSSTRSGSFIKGEVIPWNYLVTLFAPDFYGNPVTRNDWFGHYAEWNMYIGVIPLFLALWAIVSGKNRKKTFFIGIGLLSFIFAFPTPANNLLYALKIPVVSTSAASRIMILFSFVLATLSAFGLDEMQDIWKKGLIRKFLLFTAICISFLAVLWGVLLFFHPFSPSNIAIAKRNLLLPTFLGVMGMLFGILGFSKKFKLHQILLIFLLFLAGYDMSRFAAKWMPFDSRSFMYPTVNSVSFLQKTAGNDRIFGNIGNEVGGTYKLQLIEGYDAMYQGRYAEFINATSKGIIVPGDRSVVQFDKYGLYKTQALQLMGVKYIYQKLSDGKNIWAFPYWEYVEDGSMKSVYRDGQYEIFEFLHTYPRAFLASSYTVISSDDKIISTLFHPGFDRKNSLVLEEDVPDKPQPGEGKATIEAYTSTHITIKTESEVSKLLFLSDVFDSGWTANIDGVKTKIYRADYDFRAVSVPAGQHMIQFNYIPQSFVKGVYMSVAAFVISIVLLFLL